MKKILKILGVILAVILILITLTYFLLNEKQPLGKTDPQADVLAQKVFTAVNKPGWDKVAFIQWDFRGGHHYVWDKKRKLVQVKFDEYEVYINTDNEKGKVFKNGEELLNEKTNELVRKAIDFFNNDSFWLCAPTKLFDAGTERSIVDLENGEQGLMITYTSGGTTPGDSYLWILDENGLPKSIKMWVKIIPMGGLEFTWEDWMTLPSGAKIAQKHESKILEVPISNVKTAESAEALGASEIKFKEVLGE